MQNKLKKIVSLLLSLVMIMGAILPLSTVLAVEELEELVELSNEFEDQVDSQENLES